MQSRVPKYNGDPHGPDGKLLSNFIPFAVLKSQNRRIYNDEVTRPDAEFCLHRAIRWAQESWPIACAWTRLRWKIEGWKITQVTTI